MTHDIELPDGTPAHFRNRQWICPDPKALPVLEYFTEKAIEKMGAEEYPNVSGQVVREVVAMITGARIIRIEPIRKRQLPPGADY